MAMRIEGRRWLGARWSTSSWSRHGPGAKLQCTNAEVAYGQSAKLNDAIGGFPMLARLRRHAPGGVPVCLEKNRLK